MRAGVGLFLIWLSSANPVLGAVITSEPIKGKDFHLIIIEGRLEFGDEKKFADLVIRIPDALVALGCEGGNLHAGMEIGRITRLKGYGTLVPDDVYCASACALAWLGGRIRAMSSAARVGFHAGFRMERGKPEVDSAANALVGAYLNSLGLSQQFIIFATKAPPEGMQWLNFQHAKALGLEVRQIDDKQVEAPSPQAPAPPKTKARLEDPPARVDPPAKAPESASEQWAGQVRRARNGPDTQRGPC
jgi:hypothetical protein